MPNLGDTLLAVVSHAGRITWGQFENYAEAIFRDNSVQTPFVRRSLSRLGHIDYWFGEYFSIVVAKPSLVLLPPNETKAWSGVLCGQRNEELVTQLLNIAKSVGVSAIHSNQGVCPDRIEFKAEREEMLISFAFLGYLEWAGAAAAKITATLPAVMLRGAELRQTQTIEPNDMEWFDVQSFKFSNLRLQDSTVCRKRSFGREYSYFVRGDSAWPLRSSSASYLACADNGIKPIEYDRKSKTVRIPGRLPLPELHERALVLCSGNEPDFDGRNLNYRNVPEALLPMIQDSLFNVIEV